MEIVLNKLYFRVGQYFKNKTYIERLFCSKVRFLLNFLDWSARKVPDDGVVQAGETLVAEDVGYLKLQGGGELVGVPHVHESARKILEDFNQADVDWKSKPHLYTGLLCKENISIHSPYLEFALQPALIDIVTKYLGILPVLSHVGLWYSPPSNGEHKNSQLFHCDQADVKQVKVFVLCSDVTSNEGPLTLINASKTREIQKGIGYKWTDEQQMVSDDVILKYVKKDEIFECVGRAGDVFLADTSRCFHYGSRVKGKSSPRLVAVFQYLSPYAFQFGKNYRASLPFADIDPKGLDYRQKMVLGIS